MAFCVYINTADHRSIRVGPFATREAAEHAAATIAGNAAQGNLSNIESIEISGDVLLAAGHGPPPNPVAPPSQTETEDAP